MTRGSHCTRFKVHTVDGREDIVQFATFDSCKGGALWNIIQQYIDNTAFFDSLLLKLIIAIRQSARVIVPT